MVALSAMSYFNRTIMSIAGPSIMKEFDISPPAMGTVYSAFLVSYTILMTPGGLVADRFGPRWALAVTGMGTALFTGLTPLGARPGLGAILGVVPALWVMRLMVGVCTAPLYPACGRLTASWFPPGSRARVVGAIMAASALGSAISPMLFVALMARFGWRESFWIAGAATAVLILLWFVSVRDHPADAVSWAAPALAAGESRWRMLASRNMALLTISYFCLNYFEYIFFYWIYYYFGEIRHVGAAESAAYVTILMLTMAVMTPFGGWISDLLVSRLGIKTGRRVVPMVGMTLSAILLCAGASGVGVAATVALLSLAFGCAGSAEGPYWASAIDVGGGSAGAACGILNTGGNFGGTLAPIITPLIALHFGWSWGLYFGSLVVLIGVVVWFWIDPTARAAKTSTAYADA
jgi:MFS family permease